MTQQAVTLLAALVIFVRVELVMNLMNRACRLPVRVAFWALGVGSIGLALSVTQGYQPNWATAIAMAGVALLLCRERRLRGLLHQRREPT